MNGWESGYYLGCRVSDQLEEGVTGTVIEAKCDETTDQDSSSV